MVGSSFASKSDVSARDLDTIDVDGEFVELVVIVEATIVVVDVNGGEFVEHGSFLEGAPVDCSKVDVILQM